jgi:hypothetical protein
MPWPWPVRSIDKSKERKRKMGRKRERESARREGRWRLQAPWHEGGVSCYNTVKTKNNRGCSTEKKTLASSLESRRNSSIADEPMVALMTRKHRGETLNETNAAVPLDSADDAWIESNSSLELSLKLEPSQTSTSNSESFRSKLGKGFRNLERARREDSSHIYC